jgi:TonB family protein
MTLTIKDTPDLNNPGKPAAPSQNSENKTGQSPRSNPVCLEVSIIIRSLPNEANGLAQPIREEGRTVIVFDNGAVIRSTNNMPIGQTVILSNPNGRDVVCRVVGGRNLPSIKGYVEVEFLEPVSDFWGIHRDNNPAAVTAPPAALSVTREAAVPPPPAPGVTSRATSPVEASSKPASGSLGSGPSFEDIAGLVSMPSSASTRESKFESARPGPERASRNESDYNLSEIAASTSVANWRPSSPESAAEKHAASAGMEASSASSPNSTPSRDFLSKGLMAYEKPGSSSSASNGRMPLVVGAVAVALASVCAVVFFAHRRVAPLSAAKAPVVSQPSTPEPPAAITPPEPAKPLQEEADQAATQAQAQPVAIDQPQPVAAPAPVPAVVTNPITTDSPVESRSARRQDKKTVVAKQPEVASPRRPVIPNLKIGAPSAPNQALANLNDATTPITEVSSTEAVGGSTPAGLLTSAGRTSNPPVAPPSAAAPPAPAPASAPRVVREPKMISSTRPAYPAPAKASNIQGTVTVIATVDENGKVASARALNGPLLLRQAAADSVRQWKFSPGTIDGKAAPSEVTVGVEFRID